MDEWKKWFGRWWLTMGLAAFAVSGFMRWSDSELAQSEAMKTLDNTLMVIMVPLTLVLIVVRNVEVYRQSARLWWRRCRRWCWQLGACMLVIPTAMFAYKDKWDDLPLTLSIAAVSLAIAAVAHLRLRYWHGTDGQ